MEDDGKKRKLTKICVITGTRADYGILSGVMRLIKEDPAMILQTVVTNMHLSPEYGMTVGEIEADGFVVDRRVEMLLSSDSPVGTVKSMGLATIGFADALSELEPDMALILGDRYEILAAASAAALLGIPVAHIHGGEITEGAWDDSIRHAVTKLSYLHFTAAEEYRRRVIGMGEAPDRVFNVGSAAVDAISRFRPMSKEDLESSLGLRLADDFLLVTFHPATMHPGEAASQTRALLDALDGCVMDDTPHGEIKVLFTMPNSDAEGRTVGKMVSDWCDRNVGRAHAVVSLGRDRYYSALSYCAAVVGNSSSGLIEAPSFGVPTLNIGDRQKGRARGNTVYDCEAVKEDISAGLRLIMSKETRERCRCHGVNPCHVPGTARRIHDILSEWGTTTDRYPVKRFFDSGSCMYFSEREKMSDLGEICLQD